VAPAPSFVLTSPSTGIFTKVALKSGLLHWVMVMVSVSAPASQPVEDSVKVKVTLPGATEVTKPLLSTVATVGSLEAQVPTDDDPTMVVPPKQISSKPKILTVGAVLTVIGSVASATQPVVPSVNVKKAVPGDIPVTTPTFDTVATESALDTQVPPAPGVTCDNPPIQISSEPDIATVGLPFTVTGAEATDLHKVVLLVKVNVATPWLTAVMVPPLVMVAIASLLDAQVPPVPGVIVVVSPIHNSLSAGAVMVGPGSTVNESLGSESQPLDNLVKINDTLPGANGVTKPALVMVAIAGSEDAQVPPVVGVMFTAIPTQVLLSNNTVVGFGSTVNCAVSGDTQPVIVSVNINSAVPAVIPVTVAPATDATAASVLAQVPPVAGNNTRVSLIHILASGNETGVGAFTKIPSVASDAQPASLIKVKKATPCATPTTFPSGVTEAMAVLLDAQVPPVVGLNVVVSPIHTAVSPVMLTLGFNEMVAFNGLDGQKVLACV
jgi:hypothetical protein